MSYKIHLILRVHHIYTSASKCAMLNGQMFELWVPMDSHCVNCISRPTTHWLRKQMAIRHPTSHICLNNNRHTSAVAPWAAVGRGATYSTLKGHPWYHNSSMFPLSGSCDTWGSKSNANQSREEAGNALLTQTRKNAWQASNNNNNTKLFQIWSKQVCNPPIGIVGAILKITPALRKVS